MSLPKLNTPIFELNLPSTGETVRYRPFLVREHKILMTMADADYVEVSRVVRDLIGACTFEKIDTEKLPHFDVEYVFLHLRAKSIGETVDVIVNCQCGNKIDTSFSIDDLKIERQDGHTSKIMITDKIGVEMSYPKFSDVVKVFESKDTEKVINLITESIKGVFDEHNYWDTKDQTQNEINDFVNSLTKDQFEKIENFFTSSPKVVQEIECDCNQCGKHNVSRLEGLTNFFV